MVEFEGRKLTAMSDPTEYLKMMYGEIDNQIGSMLDLSE